MVFIVILSVTIFFYTKNSHNNSDSGKDKNTAQISSNTNDEKHQEKGFSPLNYEFNPHVISKEYLKIYGTEIEDLFYGFCDAVMNVQDTFKCPSVERFNQILAISKNCLPVASQYVNKEKIRVENGIGYISYNIEKNELRENIEKFKEKVTKLISSSVPYKEDSFIMSMELLKAVASKDKFDVDGDSPNEALKLQPYRAIMDNIGICQEIAGEYIYYLLQVGINATTCSGLSKNKNFSHMWTVIELDGEHYHVDPTHTIDHKDSLAFFCLNDAMRLQYGDLDINSFSFAESSKINYRINSERFKDLWGAQTYTIDRTNRKIHMKTFYKGEDKEYSY